MPPVSRQSAAFRKPGPQPIPTETLLNEGFEQTVMGAVMRDGAPALEQCDELGLQVEHFVLDSHRRIFRTAEPLIRAGVVLDLVVLSDALRQSGELDTVGGPAYLTSLMDGVPRSCDIKFHVRKVVDGWRRRQAIQAALLAAKSLRDTATPVDEAIASSTTSLNALLERPGTVSAPEFSEDAVALAFTERHGENLRYTAAWNRWHRWNGAYWGEDTTLDVYDLARATCRDEALRCEAPAVAKSITSARTRAAVESLARADRRHVATIDHWDSDEWLLNTPGGTIDLKTGEMREARREDFITRITTVAPDRACGIPRWLEFLLQITNGDAELKAYLQRVAGYILTGSTREHSLFFFFGTGRNGKGTFVATLTGILGDGYARTAPIETFVESQTDRHPTELAMLRGARLVTAVETEQGRRWAEAKLKMLTGGDTVSARFMRQDFFEYRPAFKLVIQGNHKPSLRSVDEAIRARIPIVPFTVTIPPEKRDPDLAEKLRAEWPGILEWMVEGCQLYLRDGLQAPKSVTAATAMYLEGEDTLGRWVEERLVAAPQSFTTSSVLFANWSSWAIAAGEPVGTQKALTSALEDRLNAMGWKLKPGRAGSGGPRGLWGVGTKGE